jgi:hypothetical protein
MKMRTPPNIQAAKAPKTANTAQERAKNKAVQMVYRKKTIQPQSTAQSTKISHPITKKLFKRINSEDPDHAVEAINEMEFLVENRVTTQKTLILLIRGDITISHFDRDPLPSEHPLIFTDSNRIIAIVNAANAELILGGGVAGAIKSAGGSEIQLLCNQVMKGIKHLRCGEARQTAAGNMKWCQFVIHTVGPRYDQKLEKEMKQLL